MSKPELYHFGPLQWTSAADPETGKTSTRGEFPGYICEYWAVRVDGWDNPAGTLQGDDGTLFTPVRAVIRPDGLAAYLEMRWFDGEWIDIARGLDACSPADRERVWRGGNILRMGELIRWGRREDTGTFRGRNDLVGTLQPIVRRFRERYKRDPTQEELAEQFDSDPMLQERVARNNAPVSVRQLQRWVRDAKFASYQEFLKHVT